MFKFSYVKDAETGDRYWIDKATLLNEDGSHSDPSLGDWYEIDLQPCDPNGNPLVGVDLICFGDNEVCVTQGLGRSTTGNHSNVRARATPVFVSATEPDTLIVPKVGRP